MGFLGSRIVLKVLKPHFNQNQSPQDHIILTFYHKSQYLMSVVLPTSLMLQPFQSQMMQDFEYDIGNMDVYFELNIYFFPQLVFIPFLKAQLDFIHSTLRLI